MDLDALVRIACLDGAWLPLGSAAVLPDGQGALTGGWDGLISVRELPSGARRQTLEGHAAFVGALAVQPGGRLLVSGSDDRTLRVWDLDARRSVARWDSDVSVTACAIAPSGRVVLGDKVGGVIFLDLTWPQ